MTLTFAVLGASQVRAGVGQLKAEVAGGVGPGMGDFFHSLSQADQHNAVSGGRFARRAVGDLTSKGLSGERRGQEKQYAVNKETRPTRRDSRGAAPQTSFSAIVQILRLT